MPLPGHTLAAELLPCVGLPYVAEAKLPSTAQGMAAERLPNKINRGRSRWAVTVLCAGKVGEPTGCEE